MPCFHCFTRQTDPARGASPWRRAVVGGEQVLICPQCQAAGVDAELDRCAACGSRRLAKALGDVMCRDCGRYGPAVLEPPVVRPAEPAAQHPLGSAPGGDVGLSGEVAAAIDRILRRRPSTT